jgi:predicted CoA-substrate-specific enzyme activase
MRDNDVVASSILVSGINYAAASRQLLDELLDTSGLAFSEIDYTIATGTGANLVSFANDKPSDVRCCARGITGIFPDVKMVIDIQAQFMRVIRVSSSGLVISSVNSEKCAAASGGLLEVIANVLQIDIQEMGPLSLKSKHPVAFTTSCAVFGETEAVSRIAEGALPEEILAASIKAV